jgi:CHAT domain-containing protein
VFSAPISPDARKQNAQQSADAAKQANELLEQALLLSDSAKSEPARLRLQEAMRLWEQLKEPGKAAKAALQMGDLHKQAGKYQDALRFYGQALAVKALPLSIRATTFNALAKLYAELYQNDLARDHYGLALDAARRIKDFHTQSIALAGLANLYHRQGKNAEALKRISEALSLNQKASAETIPSLLYLKGQIHQDAGLVKEAKVAFEEALAIYEKIGNVGGQVEALCAISMNSLLSSQKQTALKQAEQAVKLAERQNDVAGNRADKARARDLRWRARLSQARAQRALGQKEAATRSYFLAISHITAVWWAVYIATETSAIAFREVTQAAYRELVDFLMEQGRFDEAYGYAERAKGRTSLTLTAARRAKQSSENSHQSAKQDEQSQSIVSKRMQLASSDISPEQQSRLRKEIEYEELEKQRKQMVAEIERSREGLVWSQPATVAQLQKQFPNDQVALAEFFLGEKRSFVWVITQGATFFEILPSKEEIESKVNEYLKRLAVTPNHLNIENEITKARAQAEALFSTLFSSLSKHLKPNQRLIVVPDGVLYYLPFEALIHNGRYLVQDHEISYAPSASMLGLFEDSESEPRSNKAMELLAIGDPNFDSKSTGKESKNNLPARTKQISAERNFNLASLPRTRDEIKYIASLFPPDRQRVLMGDEGTEAAFKREPLSNFRRLHFATHSVSDEKFPLRSGVALTPGGDTKEDGILEVREIAKLDLDCDLVVVSACQTGRGQLLLGEGIIGLSRAFLYAGARSVIVSLWDVTDMSTGQLMKDFYKNLTQGMSNSAALRRAKLQMLENTRMQRHPYYWSSFVMVGKP